eukprot:CAMPEP_0174922400 /NCGR_PEP_ID=MMETSP1355-20121228/5851_1 /TAXON_ID=464990 /ORGANISM="Hemiselmis tepida, Strain CCMP443" /LENGTH=124 /DNA_ID=CAMNT_0016167985 /DNA_START=146 /DNA_END=516 /DNA_ORIENTATION=+
MVFFQSHGYAQSKTKHDCPLGKEKRAAVTGYISASAEIQSSLAIVIGSAESCAAVSQASCLRRAWRFGRGDRRLAEAPPWASGGTLLGTNDTKLARVTSDGSTDADSVCPLPPRFSRCSRFNIP